MKCYKRVYVLRRASGEGRSEGTVGQVEYVVIVGPSRASGLCRASGTHWQTCNQRTGKHAISQVVVSLSSISQAARSSVALYTVGRSKAKFFSR